MMHGFKDQDAERAVKEAQEQSTVVVSVEQTHQSLPEDNVDPDEIVLRPYQREIFENIEKQWFEEDSPYGSIIFMATASGKTYVAIMLILRIFGMDLQLKKLTKEQLEKKKEVAGQVTRKGGKKVAFMVPTTNLVEQQGDAINTSTDLLVEKISGNYSKIVKNMSGEQQCNYWREKMESYDVFVFTEKKLYDALKHGFVKLEEFSMLVFDECHHTDQYHFYNLIMQDFFFFDMKPGTRRPKILGLTASPVKDKVSRAFDSEIKSKLQGLANNLYSRFVSLNRDQIKQIEQQSVGVTIEQFQFSIEDKQRQVTEIETKLIAELCKLVRGAGPQMIQVKQPNLRSAGSGSSELSVEDVGAMVLNELERQNDRQVVKFLRQRERLISIDMDYIKSNIDITSFKSFDDQRLLIFIIIILKNANNLILELGPYSFTQFLEDQKQELIDRMGSEWQGRHKCREIIENFIQLQASQDLGVHQTSTKVKKLVEILNKQVAKKEQRVPKIIIFVKDRVIA